MDNCFKFIVTFLHINPHFCTVFLYHKFEHKYIPAQSFCITNLNISTFLHVENSIFHMCFHTKRGIALRHATFLFCHICFVFKTYCHARKILPVPTFQSSVLCKCCSDDSHRINFCCITSTGQIVDRSI